MPTEHKGLFFDPARNRWRVRLYRGHTVVHLSYHKTKSDAIETYEHVVDDRPEIKHPPSSTQTADILHYLRL